MFFLGFSVESVYITLMHSPNNLLMTYCTSPLMLNVGRLTLQSNVQLITTLHVREGLHLKNLLPAGIPGRRNPSEQRIFIVKSEFSKQKGILKNFLHTFYWFSKEVISLFMIKLQDRFSHICIIRINHKCRIIIAANM